MSSLWGSSETLRKWTIADGGWLSRAQRRRVHQARLRREALGELIQIDGSEHRSFEGRGPACALLVFIDDATGALMHLRFVRSESTESYFAALADYLYEHGPPVAFYSDKHSVLRVAYTDPEDDELLSFNRKQQGSTAGGPLRAAGRGTSRGKAGWKKQGQ